MYKLFDRRCVKDMVHRKTKKNIKNKRTQFTHQLLDIRDIELSFSVSRTLVTYNILRNFGQFFFSSSHRLPIVFEKESF